MIDKSRVVIEYPAKATGNRSVVLKDGIEYVFETKDYGVRGINIPDTISFLDDGTTVSNVLGQVNLR